MHWSRGLLLALVVTASLAACDPQESIVGRWTANSQGGLIAEFKADGSVAYDVKVPDLQGDGNPVGRAAAERFLESASKRHDTWRREGNLYQVTMEIAGQTSQGWFKIEDGRLTPCSQKGKIRPGATMQRLSE